VTCKKKEGENFAHFAWFGEPCKEHSYGKVKGKSHFLLYLNTVTLTAGTFEP
jgi:hypothetical protein